MSPLLGPTNDDFGKPLRQVLSRSESRRLVAQAWQEFRARGVEMPSQHAQQPRRNGLLYGMGKWIGGGPPESRANPAVRAAVSLAGVLASVALIVILSAGAAAVLATAAFIAAIPGFLLALLLNLNPGLVGLASVMTVLALLITYERLSERRQRLRQVVATGHCGGCGYDLRPLALPERCAAGGAVVCPECGAHWKRKAITPDDRCDCGESLAGLVLDDQGLSRCRGCGALFKAHRIGGGTHAVEPLR